MDALNLNAVDVTIAKPRPFVRVHLPHVGEVRVPVKPEGWLDTDHVEALSKMGGRQLDELAEIYGWVRVAVIESERGWGQRVDDTFYFLSRCMAVRWVERYNARNAAEVVPDWYMYARIGN